MINIFDNGKNIISYYRQVKFILGLSVFLLDILRLMAQRCICVRITWHRDVKPKNVIRSKQTWKLADFGLACEFDRHVELSHRSVTDLVCFGQMDVILAGKLPKSAPPPRPPKNCRFTLNTIQMVDFRASYKC